MLFKKNPNEIAYPGGKKHFTDVIKNTSTEDYLVWKHPEEDFNTNSNLIVMPGEEAIFVNCGKIEKIFTNGTYKLSTKNYPFISRLSNAFRGGISAFNCVVYFVRKTISAEVKWGTESPIQVRDKKLGISTELKARGAYQVRVEDAAIFLKNLVGNNVLLTSPSDLDKYFFNEFQSKIKTIISKNINAQEEELLGIDARLDELSEIITPIFQEILSAYGLTCVKFSISAIDIDKNDLRHQYDSIQMSMYEQTRLADVTAQSTVKQGQAEAQVTVIRGQAEREAINAMGVDAWTKQKEVEAIKELGKNSTSGEIASASSGIVMGTIIGGMLSGLSNNNSEHVCLKNEDILQNDPAIVLAKFKELLDKELITQQEYDLKKAEILKRM